MSEVYSKDLLIKKAELSDFKCVFPLLEQLWEDKKLDVEKLDKISQKKLPSKNDFAYCASYDSKIIGFIAGTIIKNYYHSGSVVYISTLIADGLYRWQSIGTHLLDTIVAYAKSNHCSAIELDANFYRYNTHDFYEYYGFYKRAFTFTLNLR